MSHTTSLSSQLACFQRQCAQVTQVVEQLEALENQVKVLDDPSSHANFAKDLAICQNCFAQVEDLTQNPTLRGIGEVVRRKLGQMSVQCKMESSALEDPQLTLLCIAEKYKSHLTEEASADFLKFEKSFPQLAGTVYRNLWRLKSSPLGLHNDYGRCAFHHKDGLLSQDNEKAEAISMIYHPLEKQLREVIDLIRDNGPFLASEKLKNIEMIYPMIVDVIYRKVWEHCGKPIPRTHPDIADPRFGELVFNGKHPKGVSIPLDAKQRMIEEIIGTLSSLFADSKFCSDQHTRRRDMRCVTVINEQLEFLKQGYYIAPSGKKYDIQPALKSCIKHSQVYQNGGRDSEPKAPRFEKTVFEVRPNNCVTIAYACASKGEKVSALNFANSNQPGGAYLNYAGSQEEELFRCTGLSLALDQTHQAQSVNFYPIHQVAGPSGGIYTRDVPLIRLGSERDYKCVEDPVTISVGTFAAFDKPQLDFSDSENPRLQGDQLQHTREKLRTYLKAAYDAGDEVLIMGAFGCGAFANPPRHIAEETMKLLNTEFENCFKRIIFSVMKDHGDGHKHNPKGNFIPFADVVKKQGGTAYGVNGDPV